MCVIFAKSLKPRIAMNKPSEIRSQILLFAATACALQVCSIPTTVGAEPREGVFSVDYHRFTLLKTNDSIIALHILPDPRQGWDGITYRWFRATGKDAKFFNRSQQKKDSIPNPKVTTGSGETDERESGNGYIVIGSILIDWSKTNGDSGYLYLVNTKEITHIYEKQFDRLDDLAESLDDGLWKETYSNTTLNGR
jgi:hypothetical protein